VPIVAYLTPPQVAKRFAVDPAKVLCWIRGGELRAVDLATRTGGRPRYRNRPCRPSRVRGQPRRPGACAAGTTTKGGPIRHSIFFKDQGE